MCGRYAFDDIKDIFEARKIIEDIASRLGDDAAESVKRGEVFPSETAAVLAQSASGSTADIMSWGYPLRTSKQLIINARSETIFSYDMFKKSISYKKCLIPCTGFFEWKNAGRSKIKHIIKPEGEEFFYLAGLYDTFPDGDKLKNRFVIVTAAANEYMKDIHSRMPLIVPKAFSENWLNGKITPDSIKRIYGMTGNIAIKPV